MAAKKPSPGKSSRGQSSLNRDWHAANRMPPNATLDQRIAWHRAHAAVCGCRPAPLSIQPHLQGTATNARSRRPGR